MKQPSRKKPNKKPLTFRWGLRTAAKVGDAAVTTVGDVLRLVLRILISALLILICTGLLFAVRKLIISEFFAVKHQKSAAPPYDRMDMNGRRLAFACHPILIYEVRSSLMRIASLRAAPAKSFSSQPSFL